MLAHWGLGRLAAGFDSARGLGSRTMKFQIFAVPLIWAMQFHYFGPRSCCCFRHLLQIFAMCWQKISGRQSTHFERIRFFFLSTDSTWNAPAPFLNNAFRWLGICLSELPTSNFQRENPEARTNSELLKLLEKLRPRKAEFIWKIQFYKLFVAFWA